MDGAAVDGFGWLIEKRCRLMRTFAGCGFTPDYVRKRLSGAQGWVYYYWALENEPFGGAERKGPGYLRQEVLAREREKGKRRV